MTSWPQLGGDAVIIDFQAILASLLLLRRNADGRYPERQPNQSYLLPLAEALRLFAIQFADDSEVDVIVTNSDGSPARRNFLLGRIGAGAVEQVIDPGRDVVAARLAVDGALSPQCTEAINRWYGRL